MKRELQYPKESNDLQVSGTSANDTRGYIIINGTRRYSYDSRIWNQEVCFAIQNTPQQFYLEVTPFTDINPLENGYINKR